MQAYALYAHEAYEPELALIRVQLAHTGTGEIDRMIPTPGDIERVQKRIKDDRRVWTNEGSIEAYEAEPEVGKCSRCSYLNQCVSGKKIVEGESDPT